MAHVMVPIINEKGGVGKSTLACSYAAWRAKDGADVFLADTNVGQQTARNWADVREHNGLLPKVRVEVMNPRQAMELAGRHDVLVVDTPGSIDRSTLAFAKRATFMLIPTGPNPTFDLTPTIKLLHGFRTEGIELWRMGVVLSMLAGDDRQRQQDEAFARQYLDDAGYRALEGAVPYVPAFGSALAEGYGLSEVTGAGKKALDAVKEVMESVTKGIRSAERRLGRTADLSKDRSRDNEGSER